MNLYFDLETIPTGNPDDCEVVAPKNYKDPDKIKAYIADHQSEAFAKRSLDALTGEIVSIAWSVDDGEIKCLMARQIGETALINGFLQSVTIDWKNTHGRLPTWIGHNICEFDLPYLWKRCVILGIKPPFLIPKDARHGGDHVYDTMKAWAGYRGYVKQSVLVKAFGIDSDQSFDGSMVWDAWQNKEYAKIREHNIADIFELREMHRRMK